MDQGSDWDARLDALELSALGLGDAASPAAPQAPAWAGPQQAQGAQPAPRASADSAVTSSLDALELSALGLGGEPCPSGGPAAGWSGRQAAEDAQAALHESLRVLAPSSAEGGTPWLPDGVVGAQDCQDGGGTASSRPHAGLCGGCSDLHDAYSLLADGSSAGAPLRSMPMLHMCACLSASHWRPFTCTCLAECLPCPSMK